MPTIQFLGPFVAGQRHFVGIHNDDVVTRVDMRGLDRFMFAPQNGGNLAG
jgi:hypothetical protein